MRAYIGPFRNGIRLYKYLEKLDPLIGENNVDRLYEFLQPILDSTINRLLDGPRKVKIKIHPHDTINADQTLAYIIVPVLQEYRDTTHSCPMVVDDADVPEDIRAITGDEATEVRWKWVLDEMIWAFTQVNDDWEDQYFSGVRDYRKVPIDPENPDGHYEMVPGENHTLTMDRGGLDDHMKRMQNGFRLFGRYYLHLWD